MSCEQYLIQSFMWKQCVTEDIFKQMAINCLKVDSERPQTLTEAELTPEMMSQLISRINQKIRRFNIKVSRGPNESDGTVYYALINNADNDMTRMANYWSHKELHYFRRLLSNIIESRNSIISSTKALNIGREEDIKFSMTSAEKLITKWSDNMWLEESDGSVAIGVRTLLEMNVYIREHFEVQDCFRCKTLCIRGSNCMTCDTKLHFHCVDSQFIPNNKCPNCSKQWATNSEVLTTTSARNSGEIFNSDGVHSEDSEDEEEVQRRDRRKRSKR